jgi:phospholipase C
MTDPRIDGISPNTCQPVNTSDPTGEKVCVAFDAVDGGPVDPHHDFDSITFQVFGTADPAAGAPARMDGFVENNANLGKGAVPFVMSVHNDTNLPVLSTLAREFAVFDHWFAQPTPTNPNREFMMSGTSHGYINNSFPDEGFPQQTHYLFLEGHGKTWRTYSHDDNWMIPAFADLRTASALKNVFWMPQFYQDLRDGTLPNFSLIQPRMATSATGPSNWQVRGGGRRVGALKRGSAVGAQHPTARRS